jgi:GH35 family endo-1,4-beta-xylanase
MRSFSKFIKDLTIYSDFLLYTRLNFNQPTNFQMNKMKLQQTILIILLFCHQMLWAQIPAGGISLIQESGVNYTKIGKETLTPISISGQSFTTGFRVVTGTDVINSWDAQVGFTKINGIDTGDAVLVAFYARTIASLQEYGEGALTVCIEDNKTYDKQIYSRVAIGKVWKQYFVPVKCKSALATSAVSYSFHTGFQSQTIEVADVKFINYQKILSFDKLPFTEITYYGRETDAAWRTPAAERINQLRKGVVELIVFDEQGNRVKDATVSIEMVKHKFGFGSAVDATKFINDQTYRKKVYELFNEIVFENDLKWGMFNPSSTYTLRRSLDSLERRKIAVRGHNVIWPSWKFMPTSVANLKTNPVALRNEIDKRIDDVTKFANGRVVDWDVLNEPYSEKDVQAILGDEVMADWFKRVRNNDRKVKLYINDYNILSSGGTDLNHQNGYFNIIKAIDANGGKIEGIGMQGHFDSNLTPIPKVFDILNRFAALGKELKITEHDINITQRAVQGDYTRDLMTVFFSHPAAKSFLFWGFWANQHWLPDGALFNADWTIRPNGEAYKDLVFNQWWTKKTDMITDDNGKASFEGFLGTYKYTITKPGKVRTGTFKIENSKQSGVANSVIFSFDADFPDQVEIKPSKPACLCEGESLTLNAPIAAGLSYKWYKGSDLLPDQTSALVVSQPGFYTLKVVKGKLEMSAEPMEVKVNPMPQSAISTIGDLTFCPGGKVSFTANSSNDVTLNWMKGTSKIHGSVKSLDIKDSGTYSLVASANGCSATSAPVVVKVYSPTDPLCTTGLDQKNNLLKIYPNPFSDTFVVESPLLTSACALELFNEAGICVYKKSDEITEGKTVVQFSEAGFYTLRISSPKAIQTFKLICNL